MTPGRLPDKRKRRAWWRRLPKHKPDILERKLGIFGTRGFVCTELALLVGILSTPWLRWFFLASAAGGVLVATVFHFRNRQECHHEPKTGIE
jgi:hypothetical protein